ncbi:hypothetical protein CsSME_00034631 [Camellia sinensis var. sinensis]
MTIWEMSVRERKFGEDEDTKVKRRREREALMKTDYKSCPFNSHNFGVFQ